MREVRVSPDGDAVAIQTDNPQDGRRAWGVFHAANGGSWTSAASVEGWETLSADG